MKDAKERSYIKGKNGLYVFSGGGKIEGAVMTEGMQAMLNNVKSKAACEKEAKVNKSKQVDTTGMSEGMKSMLNLK